MTRSLLDDVRASCAAVAARARQVAIVPEALPAVSATTLALGARVLARKKVLARRLAAVEDFSAIDTLCSDKTGTITENRTQLVDTWSMVPRDSLLRSAVLCSSYPERGVNVIDDAIITAAAHLDLDAVTREPTGWSRDSTVEPEQVSAP